VGVVQRGGEGVGWWWQKWSVEVDREQCRGGYRVRTGRVPGGGVTSGVGYLGWYQIGKVPRCVRGVEVEGGQGVEVAAVLGRRGRREQSLKAPGDMGDIQRGRTGAGRYG